MTAHRTLVVTNDFPPRQGGIQAFVHQLAIRQPTGTVVVYASDHDGSAAFDAALPFPVRRHPGGLLVPTPSARRRVLDTFTEFACDSVWFGAAAPLGVLGPALRDRGARRIVSTTHGHEAGWAMLPGARQALRRVGNGSDVITYLGDYFRRRLAPAFGPHPDLVQLTPGVDVETFRPADEPSAVRERLGLAHRPVIACVSRLVPRKGQDTLLRALPLVHRQHLRAAVLFVGEGPYRGDLERLAASLGVTGDVVFTGGVPHGELPEHYRAGDVFAMPCRTRRRGMDVEGLGIVYLEASATGLPVIAGDSGGAPDAVRDGETGYVVGGNDVATLAARLTDLLADAGLRARLGAAGRDWVARDWQWQGSADRLAALLR